VPPRLEMMYVEWPERVSDPWTLVTSLARSSRLE
jgi:hypothetical protein